MRWNRSLLGLIAMGGCTLIEIDAGDGPTPGTGTAWTDPATGPTATNTTASLPEGFRALREGVVFVVPVCDPSADEVCDGRDDDCDGWIDRGCGVEGGSGVQVTLAQDLEVDLALSVESPVGGHRLNSGSEDVEYGGRFDEPRDEACVFDDPSHFVQNAFWADPDAPAGTYRVDVSVYDDCGLFPGDIDVVAEVGIAIGGTFVGSFRFPHHQDAFASTSLQPVLEFDVQ